MAILHVLRSEPDETTMTLIKSISPNQPQFYRLYEENIDWEDFIERIFSSEKVICWW